MSLLFDEQRVYSHIEHLAVQIGPRILGSDADRQAGDYIRSYFEDLGLNVEEQTFEVEGARLLAHKLEILEPDLGEVASRPILMTPDTPAENLEGELVWVEGAQEPQVGPRLTDKIVLWSPADQLEFWAGYGAVVKYRPRAVIVIWPGVGVKPKHFQFCTEISGPYKEVTTFCITWEDGLHLLRAGAKAACLQLRSERYEATTRNIIAELQGSAHPDEIVVVGGHYDTMPDLSGATDNASGTAVTMELARLYGQRGSKRTLRFAAWGGEEGGLLGSRHYIQALKQQDKAAREADDFVKGRDKTDLEQHLLCVNLDVLGMALCHNVCYVLGPAEMNAAVDTLSKELGIPHKVEGEFYGSDAEPFALAGVPAITFARVGAAAQYMHTPEDAIDLIEVAQLRQIGTLVDAFLMRCAAQAQTWPFERQVPEELKKRIAEMLEKLGWAE